MVKTPDGYLLGRTNTLVGKIVKSTFLPDDYDPLIDKALSIEKIKIYRWFANDLLRKKIVKQMNGKILLIK